MSGRATLSRAEARGSRLKLWKTKPISLLRTSASWLSLMRLTSCPLRMYWPLLGVSRQPTMFISVDLPEPDGPMNATYSPFLIWMLTDTSALMTSWPIT